MKQKEKKMYFFFNGRGIHKLWDNSTCIHIHFIVTKEEQIVGKRKKHFLKN